MALSYFHPTVSNCFCLSLENTILNILNNNDPLLIFKDHGFVKYTSPLFSYDNTTGYITLNKKGKYLLTTNLYTISTNSINAGGLVMRYGSNHSSTSSHMQVFNAPLPYQDFNINGSIVITCENEGSDVAYVTLANDTNSLLSVVGTDPLTSVSATYFQLVYLGP